MLRILSLSVFVVIWCVLNAGAGAQEGEIDEMGNLRAFAKLYGYVRFFHPSDEAAAADWTALAIHGVRRCRTAGDPLELRRTLLEVFLPVAPSIEVLDAPLPPMEPVEKREGFAVVAWQHFGVRLSKKSNIYRSLRVGLDPRVDPLFEKRPGLGEATKSRLMGDELSCLVPLALYADDGGTLPRSDPAKLEALTKALDAIDVKGATADDVDVRLAGVTIAWNVLQHFYPYFDVVETDWDTILTESLAGALAAKDRHECFENLQRMFAKLEDGHGVVFLDKHVTKGILPVRLSWIEGQVVVTAVWETDLLKKGDVILSIDGRPALEELRHRESMISGAPHLVRHRALNVFGVGEQGTAAAIEIEREDGTSTLKVPRKSFVPNIFFSRWTPWDYPAVRELPGGLLHVNLRELDEAALKEHLPRMVGAKGVIFDYRWGGNSGTFGLLPHLTKKPLSSAQWHIPQVIYPDRKNMEFHQEGWELPPEAPFIEGRCAMITSAPVVSAGETILGIVEHYDLAELVGQTTAACNGNANYIPLPGGYRAMFTGMKVLKHDGSQHHLVGIRPEHPVKRTIAAVREDRDETLDKAIEILMK